MKHLIILILIIAPFSVTGQKITFSSEILDTKDSSIIAVRNMWKSYLTDSKNEVGKNSAFYWNQNEIDQGMMDIVNAAITVPYINGDISVYDIKKVDNDYYIIRNIWSLENNGVKTYLAIFNVFAKKDISEYKLYNSFSLTKLKLQHFQSGNLDFYYPKDYSLNNLKAKQMTDSYNMISSLYENKDTRRVTYIIGKNLDEANNYIGFDYTVWSSSFPDAAYTIKSKKIILASREDYLHEVVHSIFSPMFPNSSDLFQEGIATYYGGSNGKSYSYELDELRKMINKNPGIDLSKIDDFYKIQDNGINYFYIIGGIFIDYALKLGGIKKVEALFQYPDTTEDAIIAIDKELGIKKDDIDLFIKRYLQNY
jgi:hypothetical protein